MNNKRMTREELDQKVVELRQRLEQELEKLPAMLRSAVRETTEAKINQMLLEAESKLVAEDLINLAASRGYTLEHCTLFRQNETTTQQCFFYNLDLLKSVPPALRSAVLKGWKEEISEHLDSVVKKLEASPSCGIPGHDCGSDE